jgi:transcriptional regulator with XRE-family HTH domain
MTRKKIAESGMSGAGGKRAPRKRRQTISESGPNPVDLHVGKRLRAARLRARLSQEELGRGIGVSFQAVQKYEQGENRLSASRLYRAAQLVRQPISFFFEHLAREARSKDAAIFTADELALVRDYRQIESKEVRERLLQLLKRIGERAP